MKKLYIFLLLPTSLWGQVINHFGSIDSKWNVAKTYPAANPQNPSFVATTTTIYGFQGDTLINNEQWLKLYSTKDSAFQNNFVYQGMIRTENNTVLYLDTLNQLDTLYDFNLNVGDSVLFNLYGEYPQKIPIVSVDSVQLNGSFYKQLKFAEPNLIAFDWLNEIWIEGIGSIHGPLFPKFPVKFSEEIPDSMLLVCTTSNSQQVWKHLSFQNCYLNIVLGVTTLMDELNFKIYPNPFSEYIVIENNKKENLNVNIVNSLGQIVYQLNTISIKQVIDISGMTDGVYFLMVSNNKSSRTVKLIKKL